MDKNVLSVKDLNLRNGDRRKNFSNDFNTEDTPSLNFRVSPGGNGRFRSEGTSKWKKNQQGNEKLRSAIQAKSLSKLASNANGTMGVNDSTIGSDNSNGNNQEYESPSSFPSEEDESICNLYSSNLDANNAEAFREVETDSDSLDVSRVASIRKISQSYVLSKNYPRYFDYDNSDDDGTTSSICSGGANRNEHSNSEVEAISLTTRESRNHNVHSIPVKMGFQLNKDESLHFQALLEYRVRVVMLHPLFLIGGRSEHAFSDTYSRIFQEDLLSIGFSSAINLCKAIPQLVNRKIIDARRELHLVESPKNIRAIAGIRSGLRRIVYNILLSHPKGIYTDEFEEIFFNKTGKELTDVLKEHGYSKARTESMIYDMLDIACIVSSRNYHTLYLSERAEDPSLTDGLLSGGIESFSCTSQCNSDIDVASEQEGNVTDDNISRVIHSNAQRKNCQASNWRSCTISLENSWNVSRLEKYNDEAFSVDEQTSISESSEDENISILCGPEGYLKARLHLRVLLACWNSGKGIEVTELDKIYEALFAMKLNVEDLGFTSTKELVDCWTDLVLQIDDLPGTLFLQPSVENFRILSTFSTGLRETVFSTLLSSFPDGMDIGCFLQSLDQSYGEKFQGMLRTNGYLNYDDSISISEALQNFPYYFWKALRLLFHDMSDFVLLGCQEDGSLSVKLYSAVFPLLDFPNFDSDDLSPKIMSLNQFSAEMSLKRTYGKGTHVSYMNLYESNGIASDADSNKPDPISMAPSINTKLPLDVLKHQFRLILGSPLYVNSGIQSDQFPWVYEDRTGQSLLMTADKGVKSLMLLMPDVVSLSRSTDKIYLRKSKKNKRILSVVKSGIRQVLYWCFLKNPNGIWDELLEGWYGDFVGKSLAKSLCKHGYSISRKSYLKSISLFLDEMSDLVCHHPLDDDLYVLTFNSEDPTVGDARLLGVSQSEIQYDPMRELNDDDIGSSAPVALDIPS